MEMIQVFNVQNSERGSPKNGPSCLKIPQRVSHVKSARCSRIRDINKAGVGKTSKVIEKNQAKGKILPRERFDSSSRCPEEESPFHEE
jgi:hypothetical protein